MIMNEILSHNTIGFTEDGRHRAWGNETNLKGKVSNLPYGKERHDKDLPLCKRR